MSSRPVARWTGSVIAHERGGFVAVSDYMEFERENAELRSALTARERDALDAKRWRTAMEVVCEGDDGFVIPLEERNPHASTSEAFEAAIDRALTPSTGGS